ncbi:MAG TPA: 2-amino-4-hydroxy-6-hydroxymethyldihydropteridine diphosphokinase [Pyrinomonadaceae bacterium]|jgi:2-amino-4-hydroxy-6-hydroxymethyldihydropteridine diphosphokinase|nr:2-amino-4-hydroxy-6-hydroxymethyldihydropteridine diphosphokinase [Pyrinomonadaceae bacterium]
MDESSEGATPQVHAGRVYVGMGSNLGDRAGNLLLGVRGMLNAGLGVARLSSIYETEPVDVDEEQPAYLNMVAELCASPQQQPLPAPERLLARLLRIEYLLGRRRDAPRAARTLDLDLLLYGDELRQSELLTLPHPRLHLRRFVLAPLAELAPEGLHPVLRKTFGQLLAALPDQSPVKLWEPKAIEGEMMSDA